MATRDYFVVFGSGLPTSKSGLSPTFITFQSTTGAAATPPSISEPGSKGLYKFSFDASLTMIIFTMDGATTGLASSDRYVSGVLEAQDQMGATVSAIAAQGSSMMGLIGSTASSFGSTLVDPTDLFGHLKRAQEFREGNQTYFKSTGVLDFYSRGSSTLLREKTISDSASTTTKT